MIFAGPLSRDMKSTGISRTPAKYSRPLVKGRKGLLRASQHKARLGFLVGERQGILFHGRGKNVGVRARDLHCLTHHHDRGRVIRQRRASDGVRSARSERHPPRCDVPRVAPVRFELDRHRGGRSSRRGDLPAPFPDNRVFVGTADDNLGS